MSSHRSVASSADPTRLAELAHRVEGEYREMPGMHLTEAQACRLLALDELTAKAVLNALVGAGFLARTKTGAFIKASRE